MKRLMAATILLALAGCGARESLKPAPGKALPPRPYGATATPTPDDLLRPAPQTRPGRSDDLVSQSQERRSDDFDLPPQ